MKWFLLFLASNVVTFTYASLTLHAVLGAQRRAHLSTLATLADGDIPSSSFVQTWLQTLKGDVWVGALFLFVCLCDAMVSAFLVYHSYLVFSGVTTNETLKYDDVRLALEDGEIELYKADDGGFYIDRPRPELHAVPWNEMENIYDEGWKRNMLNVWKVQ